MNINEDKFSNKSAEEIVSDLLSQYKNNPDEALNHISKIKKDGLVLSKQIIDELKKAEDMLKDKIQKESILTDLLDKFNSKFKTYDIEVSCLPPFKKEPVKVIVNQAKGFDDPKVLEIYKKIRSKHPKSPIYLRNSELGRKVFYENSIHDFKIEAISASEHKKETLEAGTLEIAMQMAEKLWQTNRFDQVIVFNKDKPVCELNKQSKGWIVHNQKNINNTSNNQDAYTSENPIKSLTNDFLNNNTTQEVGTALLSNITGIAPHFLTPVTRSLTNVLLNRLNKTRGESVELKEDEFIEPDIFAKKDMLNSRDEFAYGLDKRLIYELHEINPAYDDTRKPAWYIPKEYWGKNSGADVNLPGGFRFDFNNKQNNQNEYDNSIEITAFKLSKLRKYLIDQQHLLSIEDWVNLVYTNPGYLKLLTELIHHKQNQLVDSKTFDQFKDKQEMMQAGKGMYVLTPNKGLEKKQYDREEKEWITTPAEQLSFTIDPDDYETDVFDDILDEIFKTISEKTGKSIEELNSTYRENAIEASKTKSTKEHNKTIASPQRPETTLSAADTGGVVPNLTDGEFPDNAPIKVVLDSITYPEKLPKKWEEIDTPEKLNAYKEEYISDDTALVKLKYRVPVKYLGVKKDGSPKYEYKEFSDTQTPPYIIPVREFKNIINDPINSDIKNKFDEKHGVENFYLLIKNDFIVKDYLDDQFYKWKNEYNEKYGLDRFDHTTVAKIYNDFKKHMHSTTIQKGEPLSSEYVTETYYIPKVIENNKNIPVIKGINSVISNLKAKHPDLAKDAITKLASVLEDITDSNNFKIFDVKKLQDFYNNELSGYEQLTNGLSPNLVNDISNLYKDLNEKDPIKAKDFISTINEVINANLYKDDILGIKTLNNKDSVSKELKNILIKYHDIADQTIDTEDKTLNRKYRNNFRFIIEALIKGLLDSIYSKDYSKGTEERHKAANAIKRIKDKLNTILDASVVAPTGNELSYAEQNAYLKAYANKFYGIDLDMDQDDILNKIIDIIKTIPLQTEGWGNDDSIVSKVNDMFKQHEKDHMIDNTVLKSKIGKHIKDYLGQAQLANILNSTEE